MLAHRKIASSLIESIAENAQLRTLISWTPRLEFVDPQPIPENDYRRNADDAVDSDWSIVETASH